MWSKNIQKDYHLLYLSLRPDKTVEDCLPETDIEDENDNVDINEWCNSHFVQRT